MSIEQKYLNIISKNGIYPDKKNLSLHLRNIFDGIDFSEKKVLDIGGGTGIHTFYAAIKGATHVDCLEPELDGSYHGMRENFHRLKTELNLKNVHMHSVTFQDYETQITDYDLILTYNVINHLDEEACKTLDTSENSRHAFIEMFQKCHSMMSSGGMMLVADCGRGNLFGDLGVYNPFASDIDWKIHQEPDFWISLMEKAGFVATSKQWSTFNSLGNLGKTLFGNRFFSYITFSHFYFWTLKK